MAMTLHISSTQGNEAGAEGLMETLVTFMAAVAGLMFSLAVAVLAEELFFGHVFRLLVARQAVPVENKQGR
jgi:hypothetical protein